MTQPRTSDGFTRREKLPVLYLGGVGRSGSTLLNRMLGQMPGHWPVGEIAYLWDRGILQDRHCGCGELFSDCPFWSKVGGIAFGGWDKLDLAETIALKRSVDQTKYIPLLLAPRLFPSYRARLERYVDLLTRLYSAVDEVTGTRVIVDSTKDASTLYVLRHAPALDVRVAQIVRDPRGVAYSWGRTKERRPPGATTPANYMPLWTVPRTCRRWLTANLLVGALGRFGTPLVRVRYEDLVRNPKEQMARIAKLFDEPLPPEAFDFIHDDAVDLTGTHTVAGNPDRYHTGRVALRTDEAWREKMPARQQRFIKMATWPLRRLYGYRR